MKKAVFISTIALAVVMGMSGCNDSDSQTKSLSNIDYGKKAMDYLVEISDSTQGIGHRQTTTQREIQAGNWIYDKVAGLGYDVFVQPFSYTPRGKTEPEYSNNYIIEKKGKTDKTILLTAHYDSTGSTKGSLGATDNGSGVVALICDC